MLWLMNLGFAAGATEPGVGAQRLPGGWLPSEPRKLRKKDESVLEDIYKVLESLNEIPDKKLEKRAKRVETKAKQVIRLESSVEYTKEMRNLTAMVNRLEQSVKKHIKETNDYNQAAIKVLMEIM